MAVQPKGLPCFAEMHSNFATNEGALLGMVGFNPFGTEHLNFGRRRALYSFDGRPVTEINLSQILLVLGTPWTNTFI